MCTVERRPDTTVKGGQCREAGQRRVIQPPQWSGLVQRRWAWLGVAAIETATVSERNRIQATPAVFEPTLTNIPMARRYVLDQIGDCPVDTEIALLLTSELVTNAIRHAGTRFEVAVEDVEGAQLRVSVSDASPDWPKVVVAPPEAQSGRGLFFVDQYASKWGVDPTPGGGKRVWFSLRCNPASPPA